MRKFFSFLLTALTVVFLTGCFDITEEITVKKNGAGQYVNKIDATKFAEQMQAFAAFDTTGEMIPKLKFSLDSTFSSTWSGYGKIKGISNVKIDTSKEYVYILTMDFEEVSALNAALSSTKGTTQPDLYAWEKGKISRKDLPINMGDMKMEDESQKEMLKGFMQDMKYTIIYHLPSDVKNVENKESKISGDKKTVTLACNLLDVMDGKIKLSDAVVYKK
jgi:PBP1b-binding outer membrane lipoprotein LpoB